MLRSLAVTAVTAAALAAVTPAAHAAPICRQVSHQGQNVVVVCVLAEPNGSGTTVAPAVYVGCAIGSQPTCALLFTSPLVEVGKTGFEPNPSFTPPDVDPGTGSVRVNAGTVGTLWVDGRAFPIAVDEFCVGDPSFC